MKIGDVLNKLKFLFKDKFFKNKKMLVLVIILIVTIIFSLVLYPNKNNAEDQKSIEQNVKPVDISSYSDVVESKIEKMLLSISEINKAEVMVVCESTEIFEYLMNHDETKGENNTSTSREEVAFKKEGSNTSPIIITSRMPKIIGVWIVVNEVSPSTKLAIINSIESVLNIDKECISILQER